MFPSLQQRKEVRAVGLKLQEEARRTAKNKAVPKAEFLLPSKSVTPVPANQTKLAKAWEEAKVRAEESVRKWWSLEKGARVKPLVMGAPVPEVQVEGMPVESGVLREQSNTPLEVVELKILLGRGEETMAGALPPRDVPVESTEEPAGQSSQGP